MNFVSTEKVYDIMLIEGVKKQTGRKKVRNIINYLRKIADEDLEQSSKLKIKIFKEEKEEKKEPEFKIVAPIIGFQHYFEDIKKSNSNSIANKAFDDEGENTPSTVDGNEEEAQQIDSSDISE